MRKLSPSSSLAARHVSPRRARLCVGVRVRRWGRGAEEGLLLSGRLGRQTARRGGRGDQDTWHVLSGGGYGAQPRAASQVGPLAEDAHTVSGEAGLRGGYEEGCK